MRTFQNKNVLSPVSNDKEETNKEKDKRKKKKKKKKKEKKSETEIFWIQLWIVYLT